MQNQITLSLQSGHGQVYTAMAKTPGIHLLFVGALACTRHRSFEMIQLQKEGRMSLLCLDEVDFITGNYLDKIEQAIEEIAEEKKPTGFLLTPGCQSALLSTDYQLMVERLTKKLGIPIHVHEACHLCGLASETSMGESNPIERLIFDFLEPAEKSKQKTVNLLGTSLFDRQSELFEFLNAAGVEKVYEIDRCHDYAEYQEMASSWLNIIVANDGEALGRRLEEKLNIPYVNLGGAFDPDSLSQAYCRMSEILDAKPLSEQYEERLKKRIAELLNKLGQTPLAIAGAPLAARWLIQSGFQVETIMMNPHMGMDPAVIRWFKENAPQVQFTFGRRGNGKGANASKAGFKKGEEKPHERKGRPEMHGGPAWAERQNAKGHGMEERGHGGRPRGRGFAQPTFLKAGYQASLNILDELERAAKAAEEEEIQ